jgi:hypothetical protein
MRLALVVAALLVVVPFAVFAYATTAPPPARHGWVAIVSVDSPPASVSLFEVQLPASVSSLATARAAATQIAMSRYGASAAVEGLFQWRGRFLSPRSPAGAFLGFSSTLS